MKLVYLKVIDPIAWQKPDARFFIDDIEYFVLNVLRTSGLLIHEDEEKIVLGEITLACDNPKLDEFGVKFPSYRDVQIINKKNIRERQDFEVTESKP